jgi:hypothetical protein
MQLMERCPIICEGVLSRQVLEMKVEVVSAADEENRSGVMDVR